MSAIWTWLTTSWLGRQILTKIGKALYALFVSIWATKKKEVREEKLETIIEKVENAKTPEQKQEAVSDIANHWGR
jgi:hypothetical protein